MTNERGLTGMDLMESLEREGVIIRQAKLILNSENLRPTKEGKAMSLVDISTRDLSTGTLVSGRVFCNHPHLGLSLVPPGAALQLLREALDNPDVQPFYKIMAMKPIRYDSANIGVLAVGCAAKESFVGNNTWIPRKEFYLDVHWVHGSNFDYSRFASPFVFQRT